LGGSNLQYYDENISNWVSAGQFTSTNEGTITISRTLPAGWQACDIITEQWRQTGTGTDIDLGDVSYNLIGECSEGCDAEKLLIETENENQNVTFTYNASEPLTGATVVFTFPQIIGFDLNEDGKYEALDGKVYDVNNPDKDKQTVFTWVGDISCNEIGAESFYFEFEPDCGAGNTNDGEAVLWSDMKVNGLSVKDSGSYDNIKYFGCTTTH